MGNYTVDQLNAMHINEVMNVCSAMGIKRYVKRNRRHKEDMINDIIEAQSAVAEAAIEDTRQADDGRGHATSQRCSDDAKLGYISGAKPGVLVAFKYRMRDGGVKYKTAAVANNDPASRILRVKTKLGTWYTVKYDDVAWVRTQGKWPRGIFQLLKEGVQHACGQDHE